MCRLRKPCASRTILQRLQTGIESRRRKGWLVDPIGPTNQISSLADAALEGPLVFDFGREHLLIPAEQGPDILGDGNLLARASRVADPYYNYIGFATAAAHYGLTTQQRTIIRLTNSFKLSKKSNHGGTNQKTLGEKRATP